MPHLEVERKVGSSDPISIRVVLPTPTDVGSRPIKFYLWSTNRDRTRRIETSEGVTATDISATEGAPEHTVWKLTFQPTPGQLEWEGVHFAEFEVDYGNNQVIPYPYGRSFIRLWLRGHKGRPAQS